MNKYTLPFLLACAAAIGLAPSAHADMQVRLYNSYGNTGGGEFDLNSVGQDEFGNPDEVPFVTNVTHNNKDFITFCLEKDEFISFATTYEVILNDEAVGGGGGPNPDPLDPRTAYLFTKFANGLLSNYDFANSVAGSRAASADALQKAIWYIEQEAGYPGNNAQAQAWIQEAAAAVDVNGSWYQQWGANSIGNVRVMNLYSLNHAGDPAHGKQDQLVMIPAPGAALLAFLGLSGAAWFRRRTI